MIIVMYFGFWFLGFLVWEMSFRNENEEKLLLSKLEILVFFWDKLYYFESN